MKAAVFKKLGQPLVVEEITEPSPASDEVIVKIGRCGICGSDLHMTEDPVFGVASGTVLGHEYAGDVVETGSQVRNLKPGDLITVSPLRGCGSCPTCLAGQPAWCTAMQLQSGGYAEYSAVTERQCVKLPASINLEDGALVEPLAVALHGLIQANMSPGARVLVLGAGPIGLGTAFWARRFGASHVVVSDLNVWQESRAYEMGATAFLARSDRLVDSVNEVIGGPPDIVFECVGKPGVIAQAIDHVRIRGTVVVLGLCTLPDSFIPFTAVSKEIRLQMSAFFDFREFCTAVDVLEADRVQPHALITGTVSLDEAPAAFEELKQRTTQCKVLINPAAQG
jgi:(R,R)-butanediol dehydrogenase/meso-butanediol dehydrogenase/diacetyl reductase